MEPEVSFSCSQDTDTEPYSEPNDFSPHHSYPTPRRYVLVFYHLLLGIVHSGFPTKVFHLLYAYMCHDHHISFDLIGTIISVEV